MAVKAKGQCYASRSGLWTGSGTGTAARVIRWDQRVSEWLCLHMLPPEWQAWKKGACLLLEYTGHGVPWLAVSLTYILSCATLDQQRLPTDFFFGLLVDLVVIGLLKFVTARPRPPYNKVHMIGSVPLDYECAFPSGHASRAVFAVLFLLTKVPQSPSWLNVSAVMWACALGCSRVLLGRHHVLDIVAAVPAAVIVLTVVQLCSTTVASALCDMFGYFRT